METKKYRKQKRVMFIDEPSDNQNHSDEIIGKYRKARSDLVSVVSRVCDDDKISENLAVEASNGSDKSVTTQDKLALYGRLCGL